MIYTCCKEKARKILVCFDGEGNPTGGTVDLFIQQPHLLCTSYPSSGVVHRPCGQARKSLCFELAEGVLMPWPWTMPLVSEGQMLGQSCEARHRNGGGAMRREREMPTSTPQTDNFKPDGEIAS